MIVVMTNGNVSQEAAPGETSAGFIPPSMNLPKTMEGSFETSFMEVVKFIDANYRTIAKKQGRAIAGLSMGGFHSKFISLNGTIAALVPVASGLAAKTGIDLPFMTAVVVGGSFFGDNLSFISDTTIAATQTQDCLMKDKFRVNCWSMSSRALI